MQGRGTMSGVKVTVIGVGAALLIAGLVYGFLPHGIALPGGDVTHTCSGPFAGTDSRMCERVNESRMPLAAALSVMGAVGVLVGLVIQNSKQGEAAEQDVESEGTSPSPPPGWYVDPGDESQLRWWDGASWTEHVQPEGQGTSL